MLSDDFTIYKLAIPTVSFLVIFLAYTSQYFFLHFESVPLRKDEVWKLNIVTLCVWVCYFRSCYVDPGRLPQNLKASPSNPQDKTQTGNRQRWCRRCEAYKPARAHHCKTCKRLNNHSQSFGYSADHAFQMHSKDGPSLSVDQQLRLALYIFPLRTVSVLHGAGYGLPRDAPVGACVLRLGKQSPSQCTPTSRLTTASADHLLVPRTISRTAYTPFPPFHHQHHPAACSVYSVCTDYVVPCIQHYNHRIMGN